MNQPQTHERLQQPVYSLAEIFLESTVRLIDLQAAAARTVFRTQARAAALFGAPDWSAVYAPEYERQFSDLFSTLAHQGVHLIRNSNEALRNVQQALGDALARQADHVTKELRSDMERLGRQAESAADEAIRSAQKAREVAQSSAGGLEGGRSART